MVRNEEAPTSATVGNIEKQVAVAILLVGTICAIGLVYLIGEPGRMAEAAQRQTANAIQEGTDTFVFLCVSCHGAHGEGGVGKPLNRPEFRQGSAQELDKMAETLRKTISRGRYGTGMPAWGQDDGGPLNTQQIDQVVTMIQYGDWNLVAARAALAPKQQAPSPGTTGAAAGNEAHAGADLAAQGKQIFQTKSCVACHGSNLQGGVGPNLQHFASQQSIAGIAPMSADNLKQWMADPAAIKPGTAMPKLGLSDAEIEALVAFLMAQK